jgi:hypothetical protein
MLSDGATVPFVNPRGAVAAALTAADSGARMTAWHAVAEIHVIWARGHLYERAAGEAEFRVRWRPSSLGAGSAHRRGVGPRAPSQRSLRSPIRASPARRNPAQARSQRSRPRRSVPDRSRHRKGEGRTQLGSARRAVARQALPIDRPPRRRLRVSRASSTRLHFDTPNAGDRRGKSAARSSGDDIRAAIHNDRCAQTAVIRRERLNGAGRRRAIIALGSLGFLASGRSVGHNGVKLTRSNELSLSWRILIVSLERAPRRFLLIDLSSGDARGPRRATHRQSCRRH